MIVRPRERAIEVVSAAGAAERFQAEARRAARERVKRHALLHQFQQGGFGRVAEPAVVGGGPSGSTTTWSPTDKVSSVALSNGNLTATFPFDGNNKAVRSTNGYTSGAIYWEVNIDTVGAGGAVGIKRSDASIAAFADQAMWSSGGTLSVTAGMTLDASPGVGYTTADVVMFALKFVGSDWYLWVGKNGTWTGTGNPAAGTNQNAHGPIGGVAWKANSNLGDFLAQKVHTLNCGATAFAYSPPSGFTAL